MNVTIGVVCYKWKALKNNEIPLQLRITKDRKKKYISLGITVKAEHWDFEKNEPKRNCPNKEEIQRIILERKREYQEQILDYKIENKQFTASSIDLTTYVARHSNCYFQLKISKLQKYFP